MTPERWEQVDQVLETALEVNAEDRPAFLDQACAGDEALRRKVDALLAAYQQAEGFSETPALEFAARALAGDQVESPVGKRLGRYKVVSLLGAGGMGEVYLAQDTALRRKAALKLLPPRYAQDAGRVRRFKQEALAASALNHPNIITIHEFGEIDGAPFIVAEFVDGQTLRQALSGGPMKLPDALSVAVQVARALEAAHAAGIIHRDIKPENIMLRPDGLVKVLDFGLAKLTEQDGEREMRGQGERGIYGNRDIETPSPSLPVPPSPPFPVSQSLSLSVPGMVIGTPRYMSPEQVRGQQLDTRSDLFSLGVVLYELIAGQPPFTGASSADVIAAILTQEPAALREAPAALESLVARALRKDSEDRHQTAGDLLTKLEQLQQQLDKGLEPQTTEPAQTGHGANFVAVGTAKVSWPNRLKRHPRRALAALAAFVMVVAFGAMVVQRRWADPAGIESLPRPLHWRNFDAGPSDSGASSSPVTADYDYRAMKPHEVTALLPGMLAGSCSRTGNAVVLKGGEGAYINLGTSVGQFGKADFTLAFWFNSTTPEAKCEVLSNRLDRSGGNFLSLRFSNNPMYPGSRLSLELCQDEELHNYLTLFSPPGLCDGNWHHFAGRRQGTQAAMFIDGVIVNVADTVNRIGDGVTDLGNGQPLLFGNSPMLLQATPKAIKVYGLSKFQGAVDELQVYDRALIDRDINSLFTSGLDTDGDGICNNLDRCPQSNRSPMVEISGCQTTVANHLLPGGCTINDRLAVCAKNSDQSADCVRRLSSELLNARAITTTEKEQLELCVSPTRVAQSP